MQLKSLSPALLVKTLAATALLMAFGAQAADKNVDPTGTWSWSRPGRDGGAERTTKLTLKAEGQKLTGKISAPGRGGEVRDTDIEKGQIKGNEISFVVTREFNGNRFSMKYVGKVDGDQIKGQTEFDRGGEAQTREWEAKRVKADK